MTDGTSRGAVMKAAVAAGGAGAYAANLGRGGTDVPRGPGTPDQASPKRQNAWNDALDVDEHGNVVPPRHHGVLYLDHERDGKPTARGRETAERALRGAEFNVNSVEQPEAALAEPFAVAERRTGFIGDGLPTENADIAEDSAVLQRDNNGILQYSSVETHGNLLLPPRPLRALSPAEPSVGATASAAGGSV